MIQLDNIHVTFSLGTPIEKKALKGLSLSLSEGEFVTVIGSNGAGKSTLMGAIAGEIFPTDGSILVDDQDVTKLPGYKRSHIVARVFQDPLAGTCSELTISENLALAYRRGRKRSLRWGLPSSLKEEFFQKVKDLDLGLESRLNTPMSLLSGGQRQAVSLLMATLSPLKILLLDEHTAALDPKTAQFVLDLTQKIISEKKLTALMITHSLHHALHFGDRTVMLHDGHVIYDVQGEERKKLTPADLLKQFGESVDDDRLLFQEKEI